jgi:hypothetical protein
VRESKEGKERGAGEERGREEGKGQGSGGKGCSNFVLHFQNPGYAPVCGVHSEFRLIIF